MSKQNKKHNRSHSSADSREATDNLYQLGLLSRPSTSSRTSTAESGRSLNYHYPHYRQEHLIRQPERATTSDSNQTFKQSSITSGTLQGPKGIYRDRSDFARQGAPPVQSVATQTFPNDSQTSFAWRAGRPMAGMLDSERSRSRRERTFVGSACAACEEPLEHTLRGERVLQFSCGHVSHEACFYEYIRESDSQYCPSCDAPLGLDTSRGGNVLDLGKLSSMVRSVTQSESASTRSSQNTPMPWDRNATPTAKDGAISPPESHGRESRGASKRDSHDSQRQRIERLGIGHPGHQRTESGNASSTEFSESQQNNNGRKHDYDVHEMETSIVDSQSRHIKSSIPPPLVTVRSEFPTLNRSRQQQSLTCLVTIEVPDGKWQPQPHELAEVPQMPQLHHENDLNGDRALRQATLPNLVAIEPPEILEQITEDLHIRVENWHGLEFQRFGAMRLHGTVRVGKDRQSWQELECYLFAEMLICVKEKRGAQATIRSTDGKRQLTRCTLKGSILIKKHLRQVQSSPDESVLTLNLSVVELPTFHLQFQDRNQLELWKRALLDLNTPIPEYEPDTSGTDDDDYSRIPKRGSSLASSYGGVRSVTTAPTEYSVSGRGTRDPRSPVSLHVPIDVVVVIPVSSSMQGLKITLLRDALKFLIQNLGERDRMGLVTFGSSGGGVPLVGMTAKVWGGWNKVLNSIKPVGQKSLRADVVEGANVAMDLLMQRKAANPISTILLISDSTTADAESVDFVIQRAEAAKVGIHSFGLGLTHKPDIIIELSSRTKASYMYVKDWMMLRECVAGCLGALQSTSHQNVKLKLRLPEGCPAKFVKISGALQITKRAAGRDAEAALGDLRFGDKRDILVQLAIDPDNSSQETLPQDPWESLVSGLEALGGSLENDEARPQSVEEVPLLQADLAYGDILRDGSVLQLPRPSLLAITMLPAVRRSKQNAHLASPPIPPHPSIVQRRMELLTSDMLTRALTLVARGQHERAHHLLNETRTILKGLGKGGLPPLPSAAGSGNNTNKRHSPANSHSNVLKPDSSSRPPTPDRRREHSPHSDTGSVLAKSSGVDIATMNSLDADIESSLEWISHPAVFSRDSRKAVLQAIGVISTQRGYTFRTSSESLWAERISGIRRLTDRSREWRETGDDALMEES